MEGTANAALVHVFVGVCTMTELDYVNNPKSTNLPTSFRKKLGPEEKRFISIVEQLWYIHRGRMPTTSQLAARCKKPEVWVKNHFSNENVIKALNDRGITAWEAHFEAELTSEQIAVAVAMTNFYDLRSSDEKLRVMGITTLQYNGWLQNAQYRELVRVLSNHALEDFEPEAIQALGRLIKQDDLGAVKFYMELTGRTQNSEVQNLKLAAQRLVEAVQRNIKDPEVIARIAMDASSALGSDKALEAVIDYNDTDPYLEVNAVERSLRGEE